MPSYEEEQSRLQQRVGGTDEDFHIEAPRAPEVNPEIYKDVEPLLFRGFLHISADINDVPFVFKSLNHHEYSLLNLSIRPGTTRKSIQRFYAMFLAYGVFMVDGVNVLVDRQSGLHEVSRLFEQMDEGAIHKVVTQMSDLNRRASRATTLAEAYSYEVYSRLRWAQLRGSDLTGTAVTGIQGTSSLGLNWSQLTWRALNHYEDLKETAEREWENAKFVASAMAGKGMSRIHGQDKHRREREQTERVDRRDKILRFALLGEPMDQDSKATPIIVARTVEDLAKQLERDLKGERDLHDEVVAAHEQAARDARDQRVQALRQFQAQYDQQQTRALVGSTEMQGLSSEEVRFRIQRRQQLVAQNLASQHVHPELTDPKVNEFHEKWDSVTRTPQMVPTTQRPPGTPFRGK
jgi:hypothetical protein